MMFDYPVRKWKDIKIFIVETCISRSRMHFNRVLLMAILVSLAIWTRVEAKPEPRPDYDFSSVQPERGLFDPLGSQFSSILEDVMSTLKCSYEEFTNNLRNIFNFSAEPSKPMSLSKCMKNITKYTSNAFEK